MIIVKLYKVDDDFNLKIDFSKLIVFV